MFDENQLVEVMWSSKVKTHYVKCGYEYTKIGDKFFVRAKDLLNSSVKKVTVVCDCCEKEYSIPYHDYTKKLDKPTYICRSCKAKIRCAKSRDKYAKDKFNRLEEICEENNYTLLTNISEYTGANMQISYLCPKHGLQTQSLGNILSGHKCIDCSYEKRGTGLRYTAKQVEDIVNDINGNILLNPDDYAGVFVKNLKIKCGECGDVYITDLDSYMHKNQTRCKHCSQSESVGEFRIRKFLEENHIDFEQEKTFINCKDIKSLPFDFYMPKYNLVLEFDGKHHFENTTFNNHEVTKKHDVIKNKYCKDHNINLLRIPYWDGNDMEEILTKELNL